ncbi:MAG: biotin/lipoyl-binding protein, partial [Pseudomonadota bacterium]
MRKSVKRVVILLLIGALSYYFWSHSATKDKESDKKKGSVAVSIATAKIGDIDIFVSGLGNIVSRNTATLRSRVDGQIIKLPFQEGQFIKQGELIAEIDSRAFKAQLEQAEGQMMRDQSLLFEAKTNLERYKTLYSQDSVAKQQLDNQQSLVKQYEG